MRLSNKAKIPIYNFIHTFLWMGFGLGLAAFFIEKYKIALLGHESIALVICPLILLAIFYLRGRQIFEYDSDGEALNFKNRNIVPFLSKPLSDEFPKYKLINYEVADYFIFRKLYVIVSSKKSHHVTLKYDISYLTKKEVNDLKFSLNKVVNNNKAKANS